MKYALTNNARTEATKGAIGTCPNCGSELVAKCGVIKVNHWAHKGIRSCDPWWENETEWHRAWKNNFSTDWQEFTFADSLTGEKHIADVRTVHGQVIEFQHSYLDSIERAKREAFYKNMIWIIDGTRLKRDYSRFLKGKAGFRSTKITGLFSHDFPDECFPSAWLGSTVPVVFDFKGMETISSEKDFRNDLYCLFPKSNRRESFVALLSRQSLINSIISGEVLKTT